MKNVLATILGFFVASATVYIFETIIGHSIFPLPEGADPMDMEWLKNNMNLVPMGSKIFVVIAHFAGIVAGMFMAAQISKQSMVSSYIVGALLLPYLCYLKNCGLQSLIVYWLLLGSF